MADGNTINAGTLAFQITAEGQAQVEKNIEALGRKLGQALNKGATGGAQSLGNALKTVSRDVSDAGARIDRIKERFRDLGVQFRAGRLNVEQYSQRLQQLEQGLQRTGNRSDLTAKDMRSLATATTLAQRAQRDLVQTDAELTQRVRQIANEVRTLRNEWQRTGENTAATKARLKELADETGRLQTELRNTDGGLERFNQEIARLSVAGRSAEATIAGIEGRMSRLGLASQVALATQGQLQQTMYRFGPAGIAAAGSLQGMADALIAAGPAAVATAGGIAAVTAGAAYLTKKGIPEVEAFGNALKVLQASGEDFTQASLDQELRRVAEAAGEAGTQFARADIATALAEIVKAGASAREGLDLLAPAMQLANITGDDLNATAARLLGNLRQFGLSASDAAKAGDELATADLAASKGAKELSEGLATVGPLAKTAGLSLAQTLGILVELDQKGLNPAQEGATGLRAVLAALLGPSAQARDTIESLGVKLEDANGKARPVLEVMYDLRAALEGNSEAGNLAARIFDTRALPAFLDLSDASKDLASRIENSNGALQDYSNTVTDGNLQKAQTDLNNAIRDLSETFTLQFADDIAAAAAGLGDFIRYVDDIISNQNKWERAAQLIRLFDPFLPRGDALPAPPAGYTRGRGGRLEPIPATPGTYIPGEAGASSGGSALQQVTKDAGDAQKSLGDLIVEADRLRAKLDAATSPQAWIDANQQIQAFTDSSEDAAQAWQAVNATARATSRELPTVQRVMDDLASAGTAAQQRALAFGNTGEAQAESLKTRISEIDKAITTLLSGGTNEVVRATDARVQYLVTRLQELRAELARVEQGIADDAARAQRQADQQRRAQLATQGGSRAEVEAQADAQRRITEEQDAAERIAQRRAERFVQTQRDDLQATQDASAEVEANLKRAADEAARIRDNAETAARATRAGSREAFFGDQARSNNDAGQAALFEADRKARAAAEATARAEERLANRRASLVKGLDEHTAAMDRNLAAADALATQERGLALERERIAASGASRQGGSLPGGAGGIPGAGFQGIRELQAELIALRNAGVDPASEAVRQLVQQINALQLAAAQKDLAENGVQGISDLTRAVLEANGVLQDTSKERALQDALAAIGDEFAQAETEAEAFGTQNELAGAKADILRKHLQDLFAEGFTPTDEGIQALIEQYQHWIDVQNKARDEANALNGALGALQGSMGSAATTFETAFGNIAMAVDGLGNAKLELQDVATAIGAAVNLLANGFAELATNAEITGATVVKAFLRMTLGVVEQVIQQLIALEALAAAEAILAGASFDFTRLAAFIAAAIAIAGFIALLGGSSPVSTGANASQGPIGNPYAGATTGSGPSATSGGIIVGQSQSAAFDVRGFQDGANTIALAGERMLLASDQMLEAARLNRRGGRVGLARTAIG